jgi:hypothetical protein
MIKKLETNKLELRKKQIDEYFMSKRKVIISGDSMYQINPLSLYIPEHKLIDVDLFLSNVRDYKIISLV